MTDCECLRASLCVFIICVCMVECRSGRLREGEVGAWVHGRVS